MKRVFHFHYDPEELAAFIKAAVHEAIKEQLSKPLVNSPPTNGSSGVLSTNQVCELLRISRPTLIKHRKEGRIKAVRLGGKIFYKQSEINKLIQ